MMREADYEVLEEYPGSASPWRARCLVCGRESTPTLNNVRHRGSRCRLCAHDRDRERLRSMSAEAGAVAAAASRVSESQAAAEVTAAGFTPLEPYPGGMHVPWKCRHEPCGVETRLRVAALRQGRSGCWTCSYRTRAVGRRIAEPEALMRDAGAEPLVPYPGSNLPWACRCLTCGEEISPRLGHVRRGSQPCAYCAGNALPPARAEAEMRLKGLEPLEPYPGSMKRWLCRCEICGAEVRPRHNSIVSGQGGCRMCGVARGAMTGFDPDAPSTVYLMLQPAYQALKIGIMNQGKSRLSQHERQGWLLLARFTYPTGREAFKVEEAVLNWWRLELGAPIALSPAQMPQGGYTETASLVRADSDETISFIVELERRFAPKAHP